MAQEYETFAAFGRALGLSERTVIEALARALRRAGPGAGGRFVAPHHRIGDDATSQAAIDELLEDALADRRARPISVRPAPRTLHFGPRFS